MVKHRRKKRTHMRGNDGGPADVTQVPRSFIFHRGHLPQLMRELETNLRNVMRPYTSVNLKVSKKNSLKDFVHVAGPIGISHFLILTATDVARYLKLCTLPRGPTITLQIDAFALMKDVASGMNKSAFNVDDCRFPPLLVMSNFDKQVPKHISLFAASIKSAFPAVNLTTGKKEHCRRVLLCHYDDSNNTIELRHYAVREHDVFDNNAIEKLLRGKKNGVPDLGNSQDVGAWLKSHNVKQERDDNDDGDAGFKIKIEKGVGDEVHEIDADVDVEPVDVDELSESESEPEPEMEMEMEGSDAGDGGDDDESDEMQQFESVSSDDDEQPVDVDDDNVNDDDAVSQADEDEVKDEPALELEPETDVKPNLQDLDALEHQRKAVELVEIGPRLCCKIIKIEEGLCNGAVLYHEYVHKSEEEIAAIAKARTDKQALKESRKKEQEANVARKLSALEEHKRVTSAGGRKRDAVDDDEQHDDDEEHDDDEQQQEHEEEEVEEEVAPPKPSANRPDKTKKFDNNRRDDKRRDDKRQFQRRDDSRRDDNRRDDNRRDDNRRDDNRRDGSRRDDDRRDDDRRDDNRRDDNRRDDSRRDDNRRQQPAPSSASPLPQKSGVRIRRAGNKKPRSN